MAEQKLWDVLQKLRNSCYASEENIRNQLRLSYAEYFALGKMERGETITCQELAERIQLSLSRCSRIVDRLHGNGFVERVDCSSDRRCKNLSLTAKGIDTKNRIDDLRNTCEARLSAVYPQKRLQVLIEELQGLTRQLEEQNKQKVSSSR